MVRYGMSQENVNLIREKAKTKDGGVYQMRGVVYRVQNGTVTHMASPPRIVECIGGINVVVGGIPQEMGWEEKAKKLLKSNFNG